MKRIKEHKKIINKMHDLYIKKNADYGDSVSVTYKKYGDVSFLVRMEDKLNRLHSLTQNKQQVADEKMEDTLIDLANYCILMLIEKRCDNNDKN